MAWHTRIAVNYKQGLERLLLPELNLAEKVKMGSHAFTTNKAMIVEWPRLMHMLATVISFRCKDFLFGIRFTHMLYFAILIISVFLIGKRICGSETGLFSAYLIAFYPAVYGLSRKFGTDFVALALASFILCFLIYEKFKSRTYSILFGISLGLSLFFTAKFLIVIIGPFLYIIMVGIKENKEKRLQYILNVILSLIIALSIASIWWYQIFDKQGAPRFIQGYFSGSYFVPAPHTLYQGRLIPLSYYLTGLCEDISPIFFALFLIGLFFCFKRKKFYQKEFIILGLSILVPYSILSFIVLPFIANYRYFLPAFSAVPLISVLGLLNISQKRNIKIYIKLLIVSCIAFGIYQFFLISYQCRYPERYPDERFHAPVKNNWEEIMSKFNNKMQQSGSIDKKISLGFAEEEYFMHEEVELLACYLDIWSNRYKIYYSGKYWVARSWEGYVTSSEGFLSNVGNFNFVIAFSQFSTKPDLSGLLKLSKKERQAAFTEARKRLSEFKIISTDVLMPEGIHIFLLQAP
jgi:hypothetical protein